MYEADDLCEETGDIGLNVPFLLQKFLMMNRVGPDYSVEKPLPVCCSNSSTAPPEKRGSETAQITRSAPRSRRFFMPLMQCPAGPDHIVGHENRLALYLAKKFHLADVRIRSAARYLGVIPLFIKQRERLLKSVGVELITIYRAGIRRQDDEILLRYVSNTDKLLYYLKGSVEVLEVEVVETVLDLFRMDVERDDPSYAQVLDHLPHSGGGETLTAFFLVLSAIRESGQHEVHPLRPRLNGRVDRHEQRENMIVYGKVTVYRPIVEGNGLVVLDILENVKVKASDRVEYLCLYLAIGEKGMPRVDFKPWRPVLVHVAGDIEQARLDIIIEIYLAGDRIPAKYGIARPKLRSCGQTCVYKFLQPAGSPDSRTLRRQDRPKFRASWDRSSSCGVPSVDGA